MTARMMDVREYNHRNAKLWIWLIWLCTMIVSALYCVITIFSFENFLDVYWNEKTNVASHRLWALLSAAILAPAMVIGFFAFGTLILLCKTIGEGGLTYSYGALHFSSLWMAVLVLQSSVTIHAYKEQMKVWAKSGTQDPDVVEWAGNKTTLAQVSYVFGYILAVVYLALFIVLFIFRNAAQKLIIAPQAAEAQAKRDEKTAQEPIGQTEAKPSDGPVPEETVPIKRHTDADKDASATGRGGLTWWRGKRKDPIKDAREDADPNV